MPNVIIPEIGDALHHTHGRKVYFCNAMSQPGETDGYSVEDHVDALKRHGVSVDAVVVADDHIPETNRARYSRQHSYPVCLRERKHDYDIICRHLLSFDDGLIRHDVKGIHDVTKDLLKGKV